MKLDLRHQAPIPAVLVGLYNDVADKARRPFCDVIEAISCENVSKLDWFLTSPAGRNIFESPFFINCCKLALVRALVERGEVLDEIVTDSPTVLEILSQYLEPHGACKVVLKQRPGAFFLPLARLGGYLGRSLLSWLLTSCCRKNNPDSVSTEPVTLIDTFIMEGFVEEDRYYPGLLEVLESDERRQIFYVPTFYRIKLAAIPGVISRLRRSGKQYLFKEDYLRLGDYVHAWAHAFRSRRLHISDNQKFYGFDLSQLIQEEIGSLLGLNSAMIGLLNYRFAMRLREAGVKVRLTVDWFENQVVDRGWNAGFGKYYPEAERIGYLGFTATPFYLCARPLASEKAAGVLPDRIGVLGSGLFNGVKEFCADLDVFAAPAFRFQHLFLPCQSASENDTFTVLVALPVSVSESRRILTMVAGAVNKISPRVRFWIKPHPTMNKDQVLAYCTDLDGVSDIVDGEFAGLLEKSDLLISVSSSVCLESLAKGVPVIVLGSDHDLTYNPIPEEIEKDAWRLCMTEEELSSAVSYFAGGERSRRESRDELASKIREEYFTEVNRETVCRFLYLEQ